MDLLKHSAEEIFRVHGFEIINDPRTPVIKYVGPDMPNETIVKKMVIAGFEIHERRPYTFEDEYRILPLLDKAAKNCIVDRSEDGVFLITDRLTEAHAYDITRRPFRYKVKNMFTEPTQHVKEWVLVGVIGSLVAAAGTAAVLNDSEKGKNLENTIEYIGARTGISEEDVGLTTLTLDAGNITVNASLAVSCYGLDGLLLFGINSLNTEDTGLLRIYENETGEVVEEFLRYGIENGTLWDTDRVGDDHSFIELRDALKNGILDLSKMDLEIALFDDELDDHQDPRDGSTCSAFFVADYDSGLIGPDGKVKIDKDNRMIPSVLVDYISKNGSKQTVGPIFWINSDDDSISTEDIDLNYPFNFVGDTNRTTENGPRGWAPYINSSGNLAIAVWNKEPDSGHDNNVGKNPDIITFDTDFAFSEEDFGNISVNRIDNNRSLIGIGSYGGILDMRNKTFTFKEIYETGENFAKAIDSTPAKIDLDRKLLYIAEGNEVFAQDALSGNKVLLVKTPTDARIVHMPYNPLFDNPNTLVIAGDNRSDYHLILKVDETKVKEIVGADLSDLNINFTNNLDSLSGQDLVNKTLDDIFAEIDFEIDNLNEIIPNKLLRKGVEVKIYNKNTSQSQNVKLTYDEKTKKTTGKYIATNTAFEHADHLKENETKDDRSYYEIVRDNLTQDLELTELTVKDKEGETNLLLKRDLPTIIDSKNIDTLKNVYEVIGNCPVELNKIRVDGENVKPWVISEEPYYALIPMIVDTEGVEFNMVATDNGSYGFGYKLVKDGQVLDIVSGRLNITDETTDLWTFNFNQSGEKETIEGALKRDIDGDEHVDLEDKIIPASDSLTKTVSISITEPQIVPEPEPTPDPDPVPTTEPTDPIQTSHQEPINNQDEADTVFTLSIGAAAAGVVVANYVLHNSGHTWSELKPKKKEETLDEDEEELDWE